MRSPKKLLVIGGVCFGLVLLALLVLPLLLRGPVAARVRAEVDRAVDADVSWRAVELSLLRGFPNLTLGLRDLRVVGHEPFAGDTLAAMERMRVSLDLGSAVRAVRGRGPLVVRSVRLERPLLSLRVREDGEKSWDVVAGAEDEEERAAEPGPDAGAGGRDLAVALRAFEILDGRVAFDDARAGLRASVEGLAHTLGGDFSRDSLVARTTTHADRATLVFGGVPYLPGVTVDFDADVAVRPGEQRVSFRENELRLNDLVLRFAGDVARAGDDVALDLTFEAPETDFRRILSMVPAMYAADFAEMETSGRFAFSGRVEGAYGADAFPTFSIRATVEDGSFRDPDLPLPARAIAFDLAVDNPGGGPDATVVSVTGFHVEIGSQPLDGALTLRTPVSDPDVDATVRGTLDLDALARTVAIPSVEEISGVVVADASVRARRSDVDSARYDRVAAEGTVAARDVVLRAPTLRQPIDVDTAALRLSPEQAQLTALRARLGSSDLEASGRIDNLLGFVMRDEPLRGTGTVHSDRFVLDEWKSGEALEAIPVPAFLDVTLDGTVDELIHGPLTMSDARGALRVQDERLTLDDFAFATLGGRIGMNGWYETRDPTQPAFAIDLAIDSVDVAGAAEAFLTVRALAPVARYARGTFSADLDLSGSLAQDMTPVLDVLDGQGALQTSRIAIEGFPLLERLSDALRFPDLGHPTLDALRSSVRIEDGRLHVQPFEAGLAGVRMTVEGSNGIDQSLDYRLALALPRGLLGDAASQVVQDLAARAGRTDTAAGATVPVTVRVGGTVGDPAVQLALGETAASARALVEDAAAAAVEERVDEARARLDAAEAEARRRAEARADSIVAEAEQRAEAIRSEARRLAAEIRAEGRRRAEEVLARATNPLARRAAEPIADRVRQEADERAGQIEREGDERAEALLAEARALADRVRAGGG